MLFGQRKKAFRLLVLAGFLFAGIGFLPAGCAGPQHIDDPSVSGPRIIDDAEFPSFTGRPRITVDPHSVSLGIANLMGTEIVFQGWEFQPDDSVFITLLGCANFERIEVVVAGGKVNPDGTFKVTVSGLTKVVDILKGNIIIDTYAEDGEYGQTLVITQDPIPAGVYLARATSLISDQTAETRMTIHSPSLMDRLKDWVGKKTGKIKDERK